MKKEQLMKILEKWIEESTKKMYDEMNNTWWKRIMFKYALYRKSEI